MPFWPFIFESTQLKQNYNLKIDWEDGDEADEELAGNNFDPNNEEDMDKMMHMMEKNGDYD